LQQQQQPRLPSVLLRAARPEAWNSIST
jgi:hypothetical protein